MLDRYFIRPTTVDRIRSSWIGDAIEQYVSWLAAQNYAARSVFIRVPLLIQFGESAQRAGAKTLAELPAHVEPFVNTWLGRYGRQYSEAQRQAAVRGVRGPIQQMLRLTVPTVARCQCRRVGAIRRYGPRVLRVFAPGPRPA